MVQVLGIAAGVGTQVLFAWTVWNLFFFLRDGAAGGGGEFSPTRDVALALLFAVPHSLLLWPPTGRRLKRIVPAEFYGCFYCVVTCFCLLLLFRFWTVSDQPLWALGGWPQTAVHTAYYLSWPALLYSIHLTGLGYQTGLTPWWHWVRRRPLPKRGFCERGAYRWLRHPIYLSFLGLIWFTPQMTLDRCLLTGLWTVYIFVGSHLKDERLAYYLGEPYRDYQRRVPGFPLIGFGPLAKHRAATAPEGATTNTRQPGEHGSRNAA